MMNKLVLGLVAGTALALGSAANATITVTGSTNLNSPNPLTDPSAVVTNGGTTTISFGQNAEPTGAYSGSFTFNNTLTNLYSIIVGTSTPGVTFSSASLTGISGTVGNFLLTPLGSNGSTIAYSLPNTLVGAGNYMFSFAGNSENGGVVNGNVTISAAVPEPATWGLMLLGFGAIGLSLRSRRRPALAQLA